MILLVLLALFFAPSQAGFGNSFRVHISDSLRLKCDELPYRTAYIGSRCYFAVAKEANYSDAQCSLIFPGAKIASNVPSVVFSSMMLEKLNSGKDSVSAEAKQFFCAYDSGYKCDAGEQSKIIPGKCAAYTDKQKRFPEAEAYCSRLGMSVPSIENELDNRMVLDSIKNFAWIRNIYSSNKWKRDYYFAKYKTCPRGQSTAPAALWSGTEIRNACGGYTSSSVIEKDGYWGSATTDHMGGMGAVCVKDAVNDFTGGRKPCIAHHQLDEETGLCEWSGPKDACLQTIDYLNRTTFLTMPNFPKETYKELYTVGMELNDIVSKVVVRRGCMYSGVGHLPGSPFELLVLGKNNLGYGEHNVPNYYFGELPTRCDGLTLIKCFCDPTEATLNDHVPAPPPNKKCIEHHVFNEATQSCEWKHDPKFCGELITNDGRRQMVEIPDWPSNQKYDFDHWTNETLRKEDFHVSITEVIVRQHCWFKLTHWAADQSYRTLEPSGYGRHEVRSYYNRKYGSIHDGTHRVICECLH